MKGAVGIKVSMTCSVRGGGGFCLISDAARAHAGSSGDVVWASVKYSGVLSLRFPLPQLTLLFLRVTVHLQAQLLALSHKVHCTGANVALQLEVLSCSSYCTYLTKKRFLFVWMNS